MSAPTVFVAVVNGAIAGDILRNGLVSRVLAADPVVRFVLLTPLVRDEAFVREFQGPRVTFEDLPAHTPQGLEARLMALVQAGYLTSEMTESVKVRRAEAIASGALRWVRTKRALASLAAPSLLRPETRYDLSDRLVRHPDVEALFDRYQPSLVVVATPGLILAEIPLLRTARRRGVRSMAVSASWDNFTNKLLPVRRVDRLIVWNDLMKEQAVSLHGYAPREVSVTGVPHFDLYFRDDTLSSRAAFLRRIGADPLRKLVTLTTSPPGLYPHFSHVIRTLVGAQESGRWGCPTQLLVRIHPRDDAGRYAEFRGLPHVIVEKPFRESFTSVDGMAVDVLPEHKRHLADTMAFSDVVVTVASTILIEASIYDTPIVNIAFDGETPSPPALSARRYYRFTHITNVTRHQPGPISDSPEELAIHVGEALADPARHAEGRRRVVREQCQFLDGRSTERVGDSLIAELADVCGTPSAAAVNS